MENYERTVELIEIANNSAGRSGKQFEKYAGSVENKINRLKNTWEQFKLNLIDEKTYKKGIDFVNNFLNRFTKIDKIDLGAIATWGIIVGKTFFSNVLNTAKNFTNGISTLIEKSGKEKRTRIEIQTNINDIHGKIDDLKKKLENLKNQQYTIQTNIGGANSGFTDFETIEEKLNQFNLTLDKTKNEFTFLDLSTDEWRNSLKQVIQDTGASEAVFNRLSNAIDLESEQLKENTNNLRAGNEELERHNQLLSREQANLQNVARRAAIGNTLVSGITTATTSLLTGTMSAEETAKIAGITMITSNISTLASALPELAHGLPAFISAAGGPATLIMTAISIFVATVLPKVITWIKDWRDAEREKTDAAYAAQKAYERQVEQLEKLADTAEKSSQRLNEHNEKFKDVFEADKTFRELSQKIVLTEEEQQELNNATKTLGEMLPDIVSYYDDENNAVIKINENYEKTLRLLKEKTIELEKQNDLDILQANYGAYKTGLEAEKNLKGQKDKYKKIVFDTGGASLPLEVDLENLSLSGLDTILKQSLVYDPVSHDLMDNTIDSDILSVASDILDEEYHEVAHYYKLDENQKKKIIDNWNEIYNALLNKYLEEQMKDSDGNLIYQKTLDEIAAGGDAEKTIKTSIKDYLENSMEEVQLDYEDSNRKDMMDKFFTDMVINDKKAMDDFNKKKGTEGFEITTWLQNYFQEDDVKKQANEIAKTVEGLDDNLYKDLVYFYDNLESLSDEKREQILNKFTGFSIYSSMKEDADNIKREQKDKAIQAAEKYNKDTVRGYGASEAFVPTNLNNISNKFLQDSAQNLVSAALTDSVITKTYNIGSNFGEEAARGYLEGFSKTYESGKYNDKQLNFLNQLDATSVNPFFKDQWIDENAMNAVKNGYFLTIDDARKAIEEHLKTLPTDLKIKTRFENVTQIEDAKETASQALENVQSQIDGMNIALRIPLKPDTKIYWNNEEKEKIMKMMQTFEKEMDKGGLGIKSVYSQLFNSDDSVNIKVLEDYIKQIQNSFGGKSLSQLKFQQNFLNQIKEGGGTLSDEEEALLNSLNESVPLFELVSELIKGIAEDAQKAYSPIEKITEALSGLSGSYKSISSEMYENKYISASTYNSALESIQKYNDIIREDETLSNDLLIDENQILQKTSQGLIGNAELLKTAIKTAINTLEAKPKDQLTPAEEEDLRKLKGFLYEMEETDLENAKKEWEKYTKAAEDAAEAVKKAKEEQEEFVKSMGSLVSNYKSAASEMIKNGKITSSTYSTLAEDLKKINERYNLNLKIGDYVDASGGFNWIKYEADITTFIQKLKEEGVEADYLTQVLNDLKDAHEELDKELEDTTEEYKKSLEEVEEKTKSVKEANKSLSDAYKDLAEKEKKVIEAQEALNEALYGTGNKRKSTLDGMYNYEQLLDTIDSDIESIKNNLEHIGPGDNISELVNSYGQAMRNKKVNLEVQKINYSRNLNSIMSNLGQYSSYYTMQNGRLLADVAALNSASMNDKIKDYIENQIETYNNSAKKISEIDKQIKQVEQDFLDFRKAYRDKYISLQEKVISTMKEEAQKELQTQQEKYAAMEEADNEYTNALEEAIQKQRELRDQANEWEDLAQKEKKLSLLQRDTSGANQKEILKQQEDIEKSRQNLLDKGIDNIIKGLKDLYSDQKKTRDAELKYQQAVLDNATFIEEANAVINSWQTADDLISWFMEHGTEVQNMTNEQLEKYAEELEQLYNDREIYMNTSMEDFTNMLNIQEEEINDAVANTAEWLTFESTRALNEVMEEVDKAIEKARDDIQSALDDVEDAKEKIVEAIENVAKAVKELETANKNAAEAAEKLASVQAKANEAAAQQASNGGNAGSLSPSAELTKNPIQQHIENIQRQMGEGAIGSSGWNVSDNDLAKIAEGIGQYIGYNNGTYYWGSTVEELSKRMFGSYNGSLHGYATPQGTFVYKSGGLVDYTGPAWVDGTPAQPEAFLSAKDTQMISNFTDVLRSLYTFIGSSNSQQVNPSIGDTHIEVHINIENVASDYDVDSAVERVKQDIINAANQTGRNVILYQ